MPIAYRDFSPAIVRSGFFSDKYEPLSQTVQRANDWIAKTGAKVLNVETLVVPAVRQEQASAVAELPAGGEMSSHWQQVVRVWHESPSSGRD